MIQNPVDDLAPENRGARLEPVPIVDLHDKRVAILASPGSFVTRIFADLFTEAGLHVDIVTWDHGSANELIPGVKIHRVELPRRQFRSQLQAVLQVIQRWGQRWSAGRFTRRTGKRKIDTWDQDLIYPYLMRGPIIREATRIQPDFVLALEASSYGIATSLFDGPRVIMPFGSDIYCAAETWPVADSLISHALRQATLTVPSSMAAAEHLRTRFRLPANRITPIFFGLPLEQYRRPTGERQAELRRKWGLPLDAVVLANCRRFRPAWGGETVRQVFLEAARQSPGVHCVLLRGGDEADELIQRTRVEVHHAGKESQFTFVQRDLSAAEYRELATLADVFVSLMGLGDMRSQSVLEFAAGGGIPVVARQREYELMCERGFHAVLTAPEDVPGTVSALMPLLRNENLRQTMRANNVHYMEAHENCLKNRPAVLQTFARLLSPP